MTGMYRQGLGELNDRIAAARAAQARRDKLERTLAATREQRAGIERRLDELGAALAREQRDVDRLEGKSLAALFHTLLGSKAERLETEREELLLARLAHDEAAAELVRVVEREAALAADIAELAGAEAALARFLADKEAWLEQHGGPVAEELFAMAEEIDRLDATLREIDEATAAGGEARGHLESMRRSLTGAQSWGLYDMFGGGYMATRIKHDRVDEARAVLPDAQVAISSFQRELEDVAVQIAIELEIDALSRFADYFFDGLIFDWKVQSKIRNAHESVVKALSQVNTALERLAEQREPLMRRREAMARRRAELIETW